MLNLYIDAMEQLLALHICCAAAETIIVTMADIGLQNQINNEIEENNLKCIINLCAHRVAYEIVFR